MKKALILLFISSLHSVCSFAQHAPITQNVILITYDGLRWQEVFNGAEKRLLRDGKFVKNTDVINKLYWCDNLEDRRRKLMPFMWNTVAQKGQIFGNRAYKNKVNVSNNFWFSYPGYNEILTGLKKDISIFSNLKLYNQNVTVLEYLNSTNAFHNKVAAFGSWELFPYIINDRRCGFVVNAGNEPVMNDSLDTQEMEINNTLKHTLSPWKSIRPDVFTQRFAIEYLKKYSPKVMFISFGETDEDAHEGKYDDYLDAINKTDGFIEEIWNYVQTNEKYRNKTTLIITTDHGRGYIFRKSWKRHGRNFPGSGQTWFAVIGPDTNPLGEIKEPEQFYQNQLASTITTLLNTNYNIYASCGKPILQVASKDTGDDQLIGWLNH
jgi:hypothetical protein